MGLWRRLFPKDGEAPNSEVKAKFRHEARKDVVVPILKEIKEYKPSPEDYYTLSAEPDYGEISSATMCLSSCVSSVQSMSDCTSVYYAVRNGS